MWKTIGNLMTTSNNPRQLDLAFLITGRIFDVTLLSVLKSIVNFTLPDMFRAFISYLGGIYNHFIRQQSNNIVKSTLETADL